MILKEALFKFCSIILSFFLLCLCSLTKKEEPIVFLKIESYQVDMSTYEGMNSTDHNFKGISPKEFIKQFHNKSSGAFYFGSSSCIHCQKIVRLLNSAAIEAKRDIYYVDVYSERYPFTDYYEDIFSILFNRLSEGENGEKVMRTPHFIIIVNGKIVSSQIGNPGDNESETIKHYLKMFEILKQ